MPRKSSRQPKNPAANRSTKRTQQIPRSLIASSAEVNHRVIPIVQNDAHVVTVVRNWLAGTATSAIGSDAVGVFAATMNSLPNSSEFTSLFDQYRFSRVEYTFWPAQTYAASAALYTPTIATIVDYDDSVAPGGFGAMQQYENCALHDPYKPFTVSFKPHVAAAAYSGAFTSYQNEKDQWIDSGSPGVIHYGLKWATPASVGSSQVWYVTGRAMIQLKNIR
jgi:hypothetical protein